MSAQQARDRKKLYVSELEERVAQLEKEVSWNLKSKSEVHYLLFIIRIEISEDA